MKNPEGKRRPVLRAGKRGRRLRMWARRAERDGEFALVVLLLVKAPELS